MPQPDNVRPRPNISSFEGDKHVERHFLLLLVFPSAESSLRGVVGGGGWREVVEEGCGRQRQERKRAEREREREAAELSWADESESQASRLSLSLSLSLSPLQGTADTLLPPSTIYYVALAVLTLHSKLINFKLILYSIQNFYFNPQLFFSQSSLVKFN